MRTKDKVIADLVKLGVSQLDAAEIWDKAAHSPYNQLETAVAEELKNMTFTNKIEAIKALRVLSAKVQPTIRTNEDGTYRIEMGIVGLKDAKDFVEAVMAFGVIDNNKVRYCSCNTELKSNHKYCSGCGQYNPYWS